jgi:hypothetical protein
MRTHSIIRLLGAALLTAGAFAVTSCGDDGEPAATSADRAREAREAGLKFAQCMREHGVDMPDPASSGGRQQFKVGPGEDTTPEEFEEANKACEKYMKDVEPPELSEEQQQEFKEAALAHARCMREHGIENFPDPTFGENGEAQVRIVKGSGIDPEDPDFKEAEEACADKMPEGPSTTQAESP